MPVKLKNIFANFSIIMLIFFSEIIAQSANNLHRFIIESISIEGNTKTKDQVIYENLSFVVGDTLTERDIRNGIEQLKNKEIFSDVTMQPGPGSEPGELNILIKIEERYWPHFRFQGGYSELDGWYLTPVSLNMDNIFGLGNFISMDLTFGDRINAFNFNYLNPNIFDSDLDFLLKASARSLNFVHYIEQKRWILPVEQGSLFLGFRSKDGFFRHFTFGVDFYSTKSDTFAWRYNSDDRLYDFPQQIDNFIGDPIKTSVFRINFNYDQRDQSFFPTNGWWMGSRLEFADSQLGSDFNFTRFILDARKYHQIYGKLIIAGRVKYGYVSYNAPFYEKFYLGGPNSLRGYNDRSLSPLGGGNQLYQADIEFRFPISQKKFPRQFLSGVLFFDSGANVNSKDFFTLKNIESAYGLGIRLRIPFIGIVRMDVAQPTNGDEKKIQFSLGHTF